MAENETLVLTDGEGRYYAVPIAVLEGFRVPDSERDALEDVVGVGDVVGFASMNSCVLTSLGFFNIGNVLPVTPTTPGAPQPQQGAIIKSKSNITNN